MPSKAAALEVVMPDDDETLTEAERIARVAARAEAKAAARAAAAANGNGGNGSSLGAVKTDGAPQVSPSAAVSICECTKG